MRAIILVEPQMGENIGAAARAMSNFGIEDLRIVNPRDGWPNSKAYDLAAHGSYVLDNAQIYTSLKSASNDLNFLYATTIQPRDMDKQVLHPKQLQQADASSNIGIIFGRERSGLTNEEISLADAIISIPTSSKNPSLNLAQAVAIASYELSQLISLKPVKKKLGELASKHDIDHFFDTFFANLSKTDFLKNPKIEPTMRINIRNMLARALKSTQDVKTMHGIVKALRKSDD
jgi:tRNA/rRNA methyltransferase